MFHQAVNEALPRNLQGEEGDQNDFDDYFDYDNKAALCPIGNDHANITKFRSLSIRLVHKNRTKVWLFEYVNLGLLLRHAPNDKDKPRLLTLNSVGQTCLSQTPVKDIGSLAEWNRGIRILLDLYMKHPSMSPVLKVQLAMNMNAYIDWINRQSTVLDFIFYDEMYRIYLAESDDWQKGTAFSGYDSELKDEATARGPPFQKGRNPSSSAGSSRSLMQQARQKLGKIKLSTGYCWLFHAGMHCDESTCKYSHTCDRCQHPRNAHSVLSCKNSKSSFSRSQSLNGNQQLAYSSAPAPVAFPRPNFSMPPPGVPPPAYVHTPEQQLAFNVTPPSHRHQKKFWSNPK